MNKVTPQIRALAFAIRLFLVATVFLGADGLHVWAADSQLCTRIVTSIMHPAQHITEMTKKGGVLYPQCFSPTWSAHPECYILTKKTVRDAWEETKVEPICVTKAAVSVVKEGLLNPSNLVLPGWMDTYATFVDITTGNADPIPPHVQERMLRLVGKPNILFSAEDIQQSRAIRNSTSAGGVLNPARKRGIVHNKLIVAKDEYFNATTCKDYAFWAHELTHRYQVRHEGSRSFTVRYLSDASKFAYEKMPHEVEAFETDRYVQAHYCPLLN